MAAYSYTFSISGFHKIDAQTVGELFENMNAKGIDITPESVLAEGRNIDSPIHSEFEWDDTLAAEKYRLEQATQLIRHIRIVREDEPEQPYKERGFVSIPGGNSVYVQMSTALSNDEYKKHLLKQAKGDMETFLAKYRRLEQLASITQPMAEYLENVG